MRKLILVGICAIITSCAASVGADSPLGADPLRIAMVLWRGETPAEQGFKAGLIKLGYKVEYTVVNAGQDRTVLRSKLEETIMPRLESFDYVYSFGTTASKMTKDLVRGKIPQLFNIVNNPVKAAIVRSITEPGENISGASHFVPVAPQIQTAMKLFKIKKLGLLFNPREKNAMLQRAQIKAVAEKFEFDVIDLRSPPAHNALQRNLKRLTDKTITVDAIYLPADSFLTSNAKLIGSSLRAAKIMTIAANKTYINGGALMGLVPDYHELGEAVAGVLDRHRKGEDLGRIPVQQIYLTRAPILVVNEKTLAALGLEIAEDVLSKAVIVK